MNPVIPPNSTPALDAASNTSTPLHESLAYPVTPTEPAVSHFDTTVEPEHKVPSASPPVSHFGTTAETEHKIPGALPRIPAGDSNAPGQGMLESAKQYIPSQQVVQDTLQSTKQVAESYIQGAQTTLQSAGETVSPYVQSLQSTLQNATESAKPYLPGFVASSQSGNNQAQLPSKETPSGSAVGVGSLPGTISETSVAELPSERTQNGSQTFANSNLPSQEVPGGSRTGVGSLPGDRSEAGVAKLPQERAREGTSPGVLATAQQSLSNAGQTAKQYVPNVAATQIPASQSVSNAGQTIKERLPESVAAYLPGTQSQAKQTTLPSTETPGGSNLGVGSLPGTISEVSVAKLPDERLQENLPSRETGNEVLGKTGGVGPLPGAPDESRVALLPEERNRPQSGQTNPFKNGTPSAPQKVTYDDNTSAKEESGKTKAVTDDQIRDKRPDPAYGAGYHPAELHPLDTTSKSSHDAKTSNTTTGKEPGTKSSADQQGSPTGERHKVGLMSKLKGEAKVIAGKLGHDEHKVEEGKHMMGK